MSIKHLLLTKNFQVFKQLFFKKKLGRTILFDALSKGLPYFFLPVFLKLMTISEYGLYTFIIYLVTTGAYIFQFGFETAKSKLYFVYDKKELGRMIFSMNIFVLLVFILVVVIDYNLNIITVYILNIDNQNFFNLEFSILILMLINAITTMLMRHLTLTNNVLTFQVWNGVKIFLLNTFVIIIAYFFLNTSLNTAQRISYELVFSLLITAPFYAYFYFNHFDYKFDFKIMRRVFELSLPMTIGGIIAIAYNLSDKYFIRKFIDYDALGIYNLTLFLIMPIGLLFTSFFDSYWVPKFFYDNKNQISIGETNKVAGILSIVLLTMLPVFLFFILFYLKVTNNPIQLNAIIGLFIFLYLSKAVDIITQFYNNFFIIAEKTYQIILINFILSIALVVLNWILIQRFGIIGGAIVLLLCSIIKFIVFFIKAHKFADSDLKLW